MQCTGGAALVVFGLDETAAHLGALVEPAISAFSERFRRRPGSQLATGLFAGPAMQGRRGAAYIRRRRLAGLLSLPQTVGMAVGMAGGMLLPAAAVLLLPDVLRYPLLIAGLLLGMVPHPESIRRLGRAMTGLGCCWIGFAACRAVLPASLMLPAASGLAVLPLAFLLQAPAPLWLLLAAASPVPSASLLLLAATSATCGWAAALIRTCARLPKPFESPASLLDEREQRFPERALQATLQEIHRLAEGLAQTSAAWLPACFDKSPVNGPVIEAVEQALNEFKPAAQRFIKRLACRRLDARQAQILLHLHRCVSDLERIGDHLYSLARHAAANRQPDILPSALQDVAHETAVAANALLATVAASITGRHDIAEAAARRILEDHDVTLRKLASAQEALRQAMEGKTVEPAAAVRYREGYAHIERLVRHVRAIALVEMQPEFWINPDAVHQRAAIGRPAVPPPIPPGPYLERLKAEEAER